MFDAITMLSLVRVGAIQTVLNPFPQWHLKPSPSECARLGGPHDPETVGDSDPTVLLFICGCIAIAVGILWCYVYNARPITNGSQLQKVYDK